MNTFREFAYDLTRPVNGQYPLPWTTLSADPEHARVFLAGMNQATAFPTSECSQDEFVETLFDPGAFRRLYLKIRPGGAPDPTQENTDAFVSRLLDRGVDGVIETNVVCYGTPRSEDLNQPEHGEGRKRGEEIFRMLITRIRPAVLIVHGAAPARALGRALGTGLPAPPSTGSANLALARIKREQFGQIEVIVLPSLSPPEYNKWINWSDEYLKRVADHVARLILK